MADAQRWVSTLLRARTAREDLAKQRLGTARRLERLAEEHAVSEHHRAGHRPTEAPQTIAAFLAAASAHQAAAATAEQAQGSALQARTAAEQSMTDLVEAARARRTAEELLERHNMVVRAREKLAGEREMDEIAARSRLDDTLNSNTSQTTDSRRGNGGQR